MTTRSRGIFSKLGRSPSYDGTRCSLAMLARDWRQTMGFLRLFLALSVVVWHMPHRLGCMLDANMAVLFFFMLSGFYMSFTINEVYAPKGAGWRQNFYVSRALRLYPAYLVMVTVMVIWFPTFRFQRF